MMSNETQGVIQLPKTLSLYQPRLFAAARPSTGSDHRKSSRCCRWSVQALSETSLPTRVEFCVESAVRRAVTRSSGG